MAFKDCLISAVEQGVIRREEAQMLADAFDERFAEKRLSLGDDAAAAAAKDALAADLRAEALEMRRRAHLMEGARRRLKADLQGYRDPAGRPDVARAATAVLSHYGYRGFSSVRGRGEAIVAMAHGKLSDLMAKHRRGLLGGRKDLVGVTDLVRELRGEATGQPAVKALAEAVGTVLEDLRQRFNAAGGAIAKLDGWGMPQTHDRAKIARLGKTMEARRAAWKEAITPLLDPDRMMDPLTRAPLGAAALPRALDHVFDQIMSEGWAHMTPSTVPRGKGALASQRQDARFLVFKDADAWLSYNGRFGRLDPISGLFDHINGMARDIAAMEILGPNPAGMVTWMRQVVSHEIAEADLGRPSFATPPARRAGVERVSRRAVADYHIDALYQYLRGRPTVSSGFAQATADIKNVMNAALLGSAAVVAAVTDPFIAASARRLAGLPVMKDIGGMLTMLSRAKRDDIVRAGVIWDEYLHVMDTEARFAGRVMGADWSRWLADRSMTVTGLKPLTEMRQLMEARAWHGALGEHADRGFDALPARLRAAMEGFGIDAGSWEIMRRSVDPNGFITPRSIERGGVAADPALAPLAIDDLATRRRVAEQLAELTMSWRERSVPSGTPNSRAVVTGTVPRGTLLGELADFALQFKTFTLSFTGLQIEAVTQAALLSGTRRGARLRGGASYAGGLMIGLTIGGAIGMQIKSLADGKDLEDMAPDNTDFWMRAMLTGGGLGLMGDFLNASQNRFGQGIGEMAVGPGLAMISDAASLAGTATGLKALRNDDSANLGREAVTFAGRTTPLLSSWWATRAAYRRVVLDQLQWLVDPKADKAFKAKVKTLRKNTGQEYWWRPGDVAPLD